MSKKHNAMNTTQKPPSVTVQDSIPTHADDPILTISEAAARLGKHRSTVSRWINDGVIKAGRHPSGIPGIRESQVTRILKEFPF